MKKFTFSVVTVMAMSTFAIAGGDITPVEPMIETPMVEESTGSFYLGLGYSYMNMDTDPYINTAPTRRLASIILLSNPPLSDHNGDAVLLLAGYNFNRYIEVEARYTGFTDCLENAAIYLKPMYPIGGVTVYGLLGYGETTYDDGDFSNSESGFQWGLGASYAVTENIGVFADYTRLYDDNGFDTENPTVDVMIDSVNVGVTYAF